MARLAPRSLIEDARAGARLLYGLQRALRPPLDLAQARARLAERRAHRETAFLGLARFGSGPNSYQLVEEEDGAG